MMQNEGDADDVKRRGWYEMMQGMKWDDAGNEYTDDWLRWKHKQ